MEDKKMKKNNIKELEITKEMYNRAKEVENLFQKTKNMDCRTEKFKKLNNKWIKLEDKFEEEISDEFGTLEIVNEYERRKREEKKIKKMDGKKMRFFKKEKTHVIAWTTSLLALPITIIAVYKGATPLQLAGWLGFVVAVQLVHLLPEALTLKEVYNDED